MADTTIIQVALDLPLRTLFDYLPLDNTPLQRGDRVIVPFGKKVLTGMVMQIKSHSHLPLEVLKPIQARCDAQPLFPASLCEFIEKASAYYHHPIGEVAFSSVPLAIRQGKAVALPESVAKHPLAPLGLSLNEQQQTAVDTITQIAGFKTVLLEGITGSGKTEVYLQACAHWLQQGKQILVLIPEISLMAQTVTRFTERFPDNVEIFHSKMTPKQRLQSWLKVRNNEIQLIIGTRSSLFLPFADLGLIIVDEEHDLSFKQQEGFRYSARDMAVLRAQLTQCPCVLGSATPSIETCFNAQNARYEHLKLDHRANQSTLPQITLLDVRHNKLQCGLSAALIKILEAELQQGGQVLLFINRRGFSPVYMCYDCTWFAECQHCHAKLTYHHAKNKMMCHHCMRPYAVPKVCPTCTSEEVHPLGQGTERLELFISERFPQYTIARLDSDVTKKKGELEHKLAQANNHEAQILIGTQMLAKGHHFPKLTLVAIVDADGGLFSVDFRAKERMAQLFIQVAGRAGRTIAGHVYIQTFHPQHPLLQYLLQQDYPSLAQALLTEREQAALPPFSHLALVRAQAKHADAPFELLQALQSQLQHQYPNALKVLGPIPAVMHKRQDQFRYQLLIQSPQRGVLHQLLTQTTAWLEQSKLAKNVRWSIDVDPQEMI